MGQRTGQALKRPIGMLFSAVLVVLVLTACGAGDENETTPTEEVTTAESEQISTESAEELVVATPTTSQPITSSPVGEVVDITHASPDAEGDEGSASPTPAIVVSAPPVTMPTEAPEVVASPQEFGDATPVTDEAVPPDAPVTGDGTGGPSLSVETSEAEATAPADEQLASADATVDSCAVESFPPYTGDAQVQITTTDVNFRNGPGTDCDVIFDEPLGEGAVVEVLSDPVTREGETDFTWVSVNIDGTVGWLVTEFLEPVE